ncbi:MAG: thiamine pyrophosphate-dependent dehydrogenase E1 component subunit alpha [Myxococcota bacterium]|jgi:pyruvate dehydrogenase E1 component alpha subunit/2-oxoisovalerate dehydrogenase E1 component alpha subunit|nr:thiamine pyrophosphate-dependent dehydrogenase E1 component subunit alpha [Myxococcota bacterium]
MLLTPRHIKASGGKPPEADKDHDKKAKGGELYGHYAANRRVLDKSAKYFVQKRKTSNDAGLSKAQLLELYRLLFETRRLEEHLVALYRQTQVVGGVYRSLGQEATAVGCAYGMRDGDYLQPLIRDLGATLTHGVMPLAMLRQYMAKATGPSGGRDLNTHFSDPNVGILGPVSMLGAMVPVLAGCLLASRFKKEDKAGLVFIGDGGSSTGAFYEGLNFAAVQKLPLVVVIESNHYAYSTPTTTQVPDGNLVRRAYGFGVDVSHVDGNDVLACYEATKLARERGLAGEGPTVIVSETYRRKGHAEHDNQAYVEDNEIEAWAKDNDPLDRYIEFLVKGKYTSKKALEKIRTEVEAELDAARDQAVAEEQPDAQTHLQAVFDDGNTPWPHYETWWRGGPTHREGS